MTRRRPPEPAPVIRQGRPLGNGESAVIRTADELSPAERFWRAEDDPRQPRFYRLSKKVHGHLMAELSDEAFVISMRNRLRFLEHGRAASAFWRRIKGLFLGSPEDNTMAGIEINRLRHLAGETPAEFLPDLQNFALPYDELLRLVSAAEAHMSASVEPQGGVDGSG